MKRIAFFDVDGTLCTSNGQVLTSSVASIRSFRKAGNLVFLCTGRSRPELLDAILEIGFDGIIGAGGGYILVGNQVLHHQTMPQKAVKDILAFFMQHDIGYYLESNDGLFGSENCKRKIKEEIQTVASKSQKSFEELNKDMSWFYELLETYQGQNVDYSRVNKISFINNTVPFQEIAIKYGKQFHMYHSTVPLFGVESGEIAIKGINKKKAIEQVLNYLQLSQDQAIGFGDGDNDLAMFEAVGYRIAMGNGTAQLKAAADEITADADEDGIARSLEQQNWLQL